MQQASSTGQSLHTTPWQPILNGPLAARAHTALDEIAATLQPQSNLVVDASLFGGAAGLAIFYTYLALANRWENADTWAMTGLETASAGTADEKTQLSFFRGFPGVAWALRGARPRPWDLGAAPRFAGWFELCRRPPRTTAGMRRPPPSTVPGLCSPSPHGRPARG